MRILLISLWAAALMLMGAGAIAAPSEEALNDPALEERAQEISKGLRCVVCKNQSINESSASLARDMRLLVREKLEEGYTDDQVVEYIVGSYGEFVLLKPRYSWRNSFLWISPLVIFLAGGFLAIAFLRNQKKPEAASVPDLSEDEQKALKSLLDEETDGTTS